MRVNLPPPQDELWRSKPRPWLAFPSDGSLWQSPPAGWGRGGPGVARRVPFLTRPASPPAPESPSKRSGSSTAWTARRDPPATLKVSAAPQDSGRRDGGAAGEATGPLSCSALLCPAVLFYDLPPPLVCARCRGRLPRSEPRKCRLDARPADSDPELAPWMDRRVHGLWQQETPTWLQPLCRLSSLAAAGWK